ncbi:hypothetical protein [Bradyrhizobium diazoefficiens]|uniref:hypothetical protein n=1 Tax=Bradyrhizobium diazoefficiens TaxID=1355477 RepID=UPI0004B3E0F4|nr:hypothetical protein [Bradyrhizobium diazoefficiens]
MSRFDAPTGPLTGAALIGGGAMAGALALGFQNYRNAQRDRWQDWTNRQLMAALDCSEAMRYGSYLDNNALREENANLKRQIADMQLSIKRQAARASQARR